MILDRLKKGLGFDDWEPNELERHMAAEFEAENYYYVDFVPFPWTRAMGAFYDYVEFECGDQMGQRIAFIVATLLGHCDAVGGWMCHHKKYTRRAIPELIFVCEGANSPTPILPSGGIASTKHLTPENSKWDLTVMQAARDAVNQTVGTFTIVLPNQRSFVTINQWNPLVCFGFDDDLIDLLKLVVPRYGLYLRGPDRGQVVA